MGQTATGIAQDDTDDTPDNKDRHDGLPLVPNPQRRVRIQEPVSTSPCDLDDPENNDAVGSVVTDEYFEVKEEIAEVIEPTEPICVHLETSDEQEVLQVAEVHLETSDEQEVLQVAEICCPELEEAEESYEYVVLCPVGERDDNAIVWNPPAKVEEDEVFTTEDSPAPEPTSTWATRRQLFRQIYSQDQRNDYCSFGSEISSPDGSINGRSISVSSYLQARQCDAAELLMNLGFGGMDPRLNIPERFTISQPPPKRLVSSSTRSLDEDDEDDPESVSASLQSYPSSWSDINSTCDRIPQRFLPSVSHSQSGSLSDSFEDDLDKTMITSVPLILEPEELEDDSFDLMRHLRLNRAPPKSLRDGVFLEPVTEELEVSSVGSASERTKISAKQESLDSLGTLSVLTVKTRKQDSMENDKVILEQPENVQDNTSVLLHEETLANSSLELPDEHLGITIDSDMNFFKESPNVEDQLNTSCTDDRNVTNEMKGTPSSFGDSESGIGSSLGTAEHDSPLSRVLSMKKTHLDTLLSGTLQESFELEEIATEDNYNGDEAGGDSAPGMEEDDQGTSSKQLRREYSDESSGFEDGEIQERLKNQIPEIQIVSIDKQPAVETCKVPSREPLDVNERRSAFSKRRSWSGTKQHRIVFEDEMPRPKAYSLDSSLHVHRRAPETKHQQDIKPMLHSRELKEGLPTISQGDDDNKAALNFNAVCTDTNTKKKSLKWTSNDDSMIIESPQKEKRTEISEHSSTDNSQSLPTRKASDYTRISNVKRFFTRIWSSKHTLRTSTLKLRTGRLGKLQSVPESSASVLPEPLEITAKPDRQEQQFSKRLHQCLDELETAEEQLFEYQTKFSAMQSISTIQESYYSKKLLVRLAWDISMVRQLRALIKQQIAEIELHLQSRKKLLLENGFDDTLPVDLSEKIVCLLAKQTRLRDFLIDLSNDVCGRWHDEDVTSQAAAQKELEHKIKSSILEELGQKLFQQIDELRQDIRAKDAIIDDLRVTVKRIENNTKLK